MFSFNDLYKILVKDSNDNPAGRITPVDIPMDAKGNYPATWFVQANASLISPVADDTAIETTGDVSMYNTLSVMNNASTDGVTVQGSLDGATWSADLPVIGVAVTPNIASGEVGVVDIKGFYAIRILKNGATVEAADVDYALSVN